MRINFKDYVRKNKISVAVTTTLLVFWSILSVSNNAWFKANILEIPKPFNGTVMPIEYIPNALTWQWDHYKDTYASIAQKDLIPLPAYNPSELVLPESKLEWGVEKDDAIRNAKIAYSVVYLGNYELDHKENVGSHLAVDIRVPQGTPVHAVANGIVTKVVEKETGFGHYIVIEHPNVPDYPNLNQKITLYSTYNHLGKIKVKKGATVEKGEVIAFSGNTGTSTTPHLHFQIDRSSAPWHPYWPFTWAEAQKAGMSFFDAINAGLNKNKAKEYTVNPLLWVQANLNTALTSSAGVSDQTESQTPVLTKFKITADKNQTYQNENILISISALDQNGDLLTQYEPSDNFKISSDSGSSRYKRTLTFEKGKAELNFTDIKVKKIKLSVSDGTVQSTLNLEFTKAPQIEPDNFNILLSRPSVNLGDKIGIVVEAIKNNKTIENYEPTENFSFKINDNKIPLKFKHGSADLIFIADKLGKTTIVAEENRLTSMLTLTVKEIENQEQTEKEDTLEENQETKETKIVENEAEWITETGTTTETEIETFLPEYTLEISGENFSLAGSPLTLIVKAYDREENLIKDFDPIEPISIQTTGKGILHPEELKKDDFINGVATVNYLASKEENAKLIFWENTEYEVGFIEEVRKASAFAVEHDGKFIVDTPELITIRAVDQNGNYAPNYSALGNVKLKLIDGDGIFEPKSLKISDFKNGIAKVIFTSKSDGDVKIKAQNGVIVGISKYLRADKKSIFTDVSTKHRFAEAIAYLKENGIISGYSDGTFRPDQTVSRVEALKMILAGFKITLDENTDLDFPDTENNSWYAPYINTAIQNAIVKGYPDGTFKPSNQVIRSEYLKILLETVKIPLEESVAVNPYYDVKKTDWFAKYALFAKKQNLFATSGNKLKPAQAVTRGEVADTIYKIMHLD